MKTEVAILHDEYPSVLRENLVGKLQNLIRFFEGTQSVRAVLDRQRDEHRVELIANVPRGGVLVVEAKADNITGALDDALDRMGRALTKYKTKLRDTRRRSH